MMKITDALMDKVENALRDKNVFGYVYRGFDDFDHEVMKIDINWGDWKHDHLRAKWVVRDVLGLNVRRWDENVTDSDGSDCYSATHILWLCDV